MRRSLLSVCGLVAFAGVVVHDRALAQDTINVGVVMPKSGPNADSVRRYVIAPVEWAAKLANDKGGVLGKQIRVIEEDGRTPEMAVAALRKLIDVDKIAADISTYTYLVLPQLPVAEESKIVLVGPATSHPDFTKNPWAVRIALTGPPQAQRTAQLVHSVGDKTAVYFSENNEAGQSMQKAFTAELSKLGGEVLATDTYKIEASDVRGELVKFKSYNPDAFYFMGTTGRPNALILQQMAEVGFHPKHIFSTYLMEDAEVQRLDPKLTEGVIWVGLDIDPEFSKAFTAALGYPPDTMAGMSFGAMQLLIDGLARAGTASDPVKLRDTIDNYGAFKTPVGTFTFAGSGDSSVAMAVKTMKAGKIVPYKP